MTNFITFIEQTTKAMIDVDHPIELTVGEVQWEDKIPLIRECRPGKGRRRGPIELVNWSLGDRLPTEAEAQLSIPLALQSRAFRALFSQPEDFTVLYNLNTGKSHAVLYHDTDHARAVGALNSLALAARHPYPRPSPYCQGCGYLSWCKQYSSS